MNTSDSLSLSDFPVRLDARNFWLKIWKNLSLILSLRNLRFCWQIFAEETDSHFRSSANPLTVACAKCIHSRLSKTSNTCLYSLFSESVSFRVFRCCALPRGPFGRQRLHVLRTARRLELQLTLASLSLRLAASDRLAVRGDGLWADRPLTLNVWELRLVSK